MELKSALLKVQGSNMILILILILILMLKVQGVMEKLQETVIRKAEQLTAASEREDTLKQALREAMSMVGDDSNTRTGFISSAPVEQKSTDQGLGVLSAVWGEIWKAEESASQDVSKHVEFERWSIRELKDYLERRGVDSSSAVEKHELVTRCERLSRSAEPPI